MKPAADDVALREPVWQAYARLYLDADYRRELRAAAREAAASGYTEAELRAILLHEVHPVLRSNLVATAGVWDGFDPAWLRARILRRARRPRWLRLDRCMRAHAEHLWRLLAPRIRRLRAAA
ncbi:MAG: hypothetical protein DI564_06385 [Rhodanobacter denitrificans]|uniref:DUF7079 domain-containing protein n=1 Tax=Rhodanobacter denitrificans TaxID=666685 RepID=A0A2W5MC56_9GAMM|nr:MAG: hypothetical protein DI564_06385 [Rhodanobacter denitrificans]